MRHGRALPSEGEDRNMRRAARAVSTVSGDKCLDGVTLYDPDLESYEIATASRSYQVWTYTTSFGM